MGTYLIEICMRVIKSVAVSWKPEWLPPTLFIECLQDFLKLGDYRNWTLTQVCRSFFPIVDHCPWLTSFPNYLGHVSINVAFLVIDMYVASLISTLSHGLQLHIYRCHPQFTKCFISFSKVICGKCICMHFSNYSVSSLTSPWLLFLMVTFSLFPVRFSVLPPTKHQFYLPLLLNHHLPNLFSTFWNIS